MAENELSFKDPHRRQTVVLKTLPVDSLGVVEHQRKARPAHTANLVASIERIGFIVPLVAIEEPGDGKPRYLVIDGQHRLQAAIEIGIRKLPVLVVPARLAPRMMNLNVEKDLNIREKAVVSLGIYRSFLETQPDQKENDSELEESIERAYYVTLGLAYEGPGRLAGSAFEPLLKKCDHFMRRTLGNAYPAREERAKRVLETNALVQEVIVKAKEMGAFHQYFQYQLISHIDPFKRKRGRQNFDELFDKATAKLEKLIEEPDRIRRLGGD
ncbi:MAG: ParB family transcriptional regulator, chromosome partitioning protein [Actinomycetota bacterium]|nr:ParB family transcriptional regulator, chromosome partitioning protein [Actinomycetota bacterium]